MKLIIGNGLIGRHIYYLLRGDVVMTTRGSVDLSKEGWEIPKCEVGYICAAVTSTKECESHREESQLVNITNTVKLTERLQPARVVWISSERVFDGSKPFRGVDEAVCPTTEYGRQKAVAEELLLNLGVTVVRFSKVIGWDMPLFEGWISELGKDRPIYPYSNMGMSPLMVSFAARVLVEKREGGLYQVSGDEDISYSQVASYIANLMGKAELVRPVEAEVGHPYTTLESNIGVRPSSWETIERWCNDRLPIRA